MCRECRITFAASQAMGVGLVGSVLVRRWPVARPVAALCLLPTRAGQRPKATHAVRGACCRTLFVLYGIPFVPSLGTLPPSVPSF